MPYLIYGICLVALMIFQTGKYGFSGQLLAYFLAPVMLAYTVSLRRDFRLIMRSNSSVLLLCITALMFLSYVTTHNSHLNYTALALQLIGVTGYFIARFILYDKHEGRRILLFQAIIAGAIFQSVVFMYNFFFNNSVDHTGHKNIIAVTSFIAVALAYYCLLNTKVYVMKSFYTYSILFLTLHIILSRCLGMTLLIAFMHIVIAFSYRRLKVIPIICLIMSIGIFFFAPEEYINKSREHLIQQYETKNLSTRTTRIWPEIWKHIKSAPISGVGIGNIYVPQERNICGSHNIFLQVWGGCGIAVIALFLLFIIDVLLSICGRDNAILKLAFVLTFIYGGVSAFAFQFPINSLLFYLLAACVHEDRLTDYDRVNAQLSKVFIRGTVYIIVLTLLPLAMRKGISALNVTSGIYAINRGDHTEAVKILSMALEAEPRNVKALYNRALAYSQIGNLKRAYDDLRRVEAYAPRYAHTQKAIRNIEDLVSKKAAQ